MHILKARDEELGTKPIFQKNRGGFFRRKILLLSCIPCSGFRPVLQES